MTVDSDWDDWLVRAVEDADPDGLAVWYLGCNGVIVKSAAGAIVYVDPYLGVADPPRTIRMIPVPFDPDDVREADAVLATHEHTDHVHGPSQAPILAGTSADFYATDSGQAVVREEGWLDRWSVTDDQLHQIEADDTIEIADLTIHVEPANDPDAEHPVSFVFEHDAGTFFHGGDARPGAFESIGNDYDIDVGVLAFGSVGMIPDKETREAVRTKWYNDENMIVEAANELQLSTLVPTHWDMWKGLTADPKALHEHVHSFPYPETLNVVEIGDRIDIE